MLHLVETILGFLLLVVGITMFGKCACDPRITRHYRVYMAFYAAFVCMPLLFLSLFIHFNIASVAIDGLSAPLASVILAAFLFVFGRGWMSERANSQLDIIVMFLAVLVMFLLGAFTYIDFVLSQAMTIMVLAVIIVFRLFQDRQDIFLKRIRDSKPESSYDGSMPRAIIFLLVAAFGIFFWLHGGASLSDEMNWPDQLIEVFTVAVLAVSPQLYAACVLRRSATNEMMVGFILSCMVWNCLITIISLMFLPPTTLIS